MNLLTQPSKYYIILYLYIISYLIIFFKEFLIFIGEKMKKLRSFPFFLVLGGVISGFINGLLGAGGGIIIVFVLSRLLKNQAQARDVFANALCVMLPISVVSCITYVLDGRISFERFPPLIIPAVAGGIIGGILLCKINATALKKLFSILVVISGIILIFK